MTQPSLYSTRWRLAVVDRILHAADRTLHIPPLILVTWGLCAAIINGVHQGRALGFPVPPDASFHVALMLLAGGIALLAASALAALVPSWFSGTLALGWLAGMVVPGIVLWSRRTDG